MKSKLWTLFKATTINHYNMNKKFNRSNRGKAIRTGMTTAVVFLFILLLSGLYSYLLMSFLKPNGLERYLFVVFGAVAIFMSFITSIYRSKSMLFDSKDNDLLLAMPIKFSTIIANRILNLLSINYVLVGALFIPTIVIYAIFVPVSIVYYPVAIICLLLLPFIPTVLASIFGYISAFISSKFGKGKIIEIIFTFGFFFFVMFVSMQVQTIAMSALNNISQIEAFISNYLFVLNWMTTAMVDLNLLHFLLFFIVNVGIFALFTVILGKGYKKITSKLGETRTKKKHGEVKYEHNSKLIALTKKEFKKFISTPIYIFNCGFGVVLLAILAIASLFMGDQLLNSIIGEQVSIQYIAVMLIGVVGFTTIMSNTASCAVSLEGKNLWILKTLPISTKQVLQSKLLTNLVVVLPISLIATIIMGLVMNVGYLTTLLIIIFEIIFALVIAEFGLLINLKFPKLKFDSEVQVIKQSTSTFLAIFVPMILFMIMIGLCAGIAMMISAKVMITILILLFGVIAVIETLLVYYWGVKKFESLE